MRRTYFRMYYIRQHNYAKPESGLCSSFNKDKDGEFLCDMTNWMDAIIGEDTVESCGSRFIILIAIFIFAFAIISKTK